MRVPIGCVLLLREHVTGWGASQDPYTWVSTGPNTLIASSASATGMGAPP